MLSTLSCSSAPVLEPPQKTLELTVVAGSTADTTWGSVVRADLHGCSIAAIDFYSRQLRYLPSPDSSWRVLAGPGPGPGELAQPRFVGFSPDGNVIVLDIGNRRVFTYDTSGATVHSRPLWVSSRPGPRSLGRIAVVSSDTLLDYWGAAEWGGRSLDRQTLQTTKVVDVVDLAPGQVASSFGDPIIPPDDDDLVLSGLLQKGDIVFDSSHVYLLRAPTATIEIYRRDNGTLVDSVALPRYRSVPDWKEVGTTTGSTGLTEKTAEFEYEPLAMAIDVLADGSFLVVVPGPRELDQSRDYPNLILVHTSRAGAVLDAWLLPITGVVDIWATAGGEVLLQGHASADFDGGAGSHLLSSGVVLPGAGGAACGWGR